MIRTETEYQNTLRKIRESEEFLQKERAALASQGLTTDEIKRATDPAFSFHEQLREETAAYERLINGNFEELTNFEGVGRLLIALRIFRGQTQRDLAEKLGVHESQVSRDERNEYHGITVERANRIVEVLGAELRTTIVATPKSAMKSANERTFVGG
ncbi:MAG: helix-turn-helix transcriptional regulator [Fimbriiglobus sp.]